MASETAAWWKFTATAFFSITVTLVGVYFTSGDRLTEERVVKLIHSNSPYVQDRALILNEQTRQGRQLSEMANNVNRLVESVARLTGKLEALTDVIAKQLEKEK